MDKPYHLKNLNSLIKNIELYPANEYARFLVRLALVANRHVLEEEQFKVIQPNLTKKEGS